MYFNFAFNFVKIFHDKRKTAFIFVYKPSRRYIIYQRNCINFNFLYYYAYNNNIVVAVVGICIYKEKCIF